MARAAYGTNPTSHQSVQDHLTEQKRREQGLVPANAYRAGPYIRFLQYSLNFTHNKWQITRFLPNEQLYILANAAMPDVQIQVPATANTAFPLKSLNIPEQEAELHHHINSLKLKVMEVVQLAKTKSSIIQQK